MWSDKSPFQLFAPPNRQNDRVWSRSILEGTCMDAMKRTGNSGNILERSMIEKMSESIFMQDGAPAHTAKLTQTWCSDHLPGYWAKADWPGNSPDLNPIENLWSILGEKLSKLPEFTTINSLVENLKIEWARIDPTILQNLTIDMPNRVKEVINRSGDYIGK